MSTAITTRTSTGWAISGLLTGAFGVAGIYASLKVDAVYDPALAGDPPAITERLATQTPQLVVMHVTMLLAVVLAVPFAAGLRRRLAGHVLPDSLLPNVAASGMALVSVAGLMGTALDTEFLFGLNTKNSKLVPEVAVLYGHWVGTVPWLWVGAGITGVAVAIAALRHAAAPRWLGWIAAIVGGLTLLVGVSPLQYLAGFTGPVLVLILGLGFAFGDRNNGS